MRKQKYQKFVICHASGDIESLLVPVFISPSDVTNKLRWSLVFYRLGKDWYFAGKSKDWKIPRAPKTGTEAYEFTKDLVSQPAFTEADWPF